MIQEQMLNKILKEKDGSIITLNNLSSDYFSDHPSEFYFIKQHLDKYGKVPDMETFLSTFPEFEVIDVEEPTGYLLEMLSKDRSKRFLATNFNKIKTLVMKDDVEGAFEVLREAERESGQSVSLQCVDLIHDKSRFEVYLDKSQNFDKYFIPTGFPELDNIIGGWDTNEDLVTIVARNGVGKTWVLLKCACEAAKAGKRVGIYSGEMSEDSVGYRIDTLIGHISNGALLHGGASIKNEYKAFIENLDKNIPGSIMVLTPKMINGSASVSALRAFVEKYELDILFVDQHSLLADDRKARVPNEKAANISTDLKLLQTIKRIPVISVCQQNREKNEGANAFDSTQIAGSDKIGQDSSIVIFLERKDDLMRLHPTKLRNAGYSGALTYRIDLNKGTWIYVPEEENGAIMSSNQSFGAEDYSKDDYDGEEVFD